MLTIIISLFTIIILVLFIVARYERAHNPQAKRAERLAELSALMTECIEEHRNLARSGISGVTYYERAQVIVGNLCSEFSKEERADAIALYQEYFYPANTLVRNWICQPGADQWLRKQVVTILRHCISGDRHSARMALRALVSVRSIAETEMIVQFISYEYSIDAQGMCRLIEY